ncbi:acyltransferase family protein [Sphingomonas sp. BIUV-7]|uniref:Acyltransferase family protein n=1 Tax=Sphingomonas natans TaxID=3063330 RepID=A0ABT8YCK8_9SPHN|nr:acyltransferase family protein [Sphingomonas sp. BIUV-7]MDO6416086.1 acyltransferase family protein [Sphingomonas sp. BIUV-7]
MNRYRSDIDGLRAIAILPVVLFHTGFSSFSGGYVGVDVFFVISGFLITSSLNNDFRAQTYSIAAFYERRIRRIMPALFAMLLLTFLVGALMLLPLDMVDLGTSMWGACLFVSNLTFWSLSGDYFGLPSERQPLLHTWSLAVEEQFYIFFPVLLAILHRFMRDRSITKLLAVLFVLSLALSIYASVRSPVANFYLLPTRAWELLAGSLVASGLRGPTSRRIAEIEGAFALFLLIVPIFAYGPNTPFPGISAVPPVLGAALIIHSGLGDSMSSAGRLLAHPLLRFVGLISYSLYLWHWPIIVYTRYGLLDVNLAQKFAIVAASVGAATLSWRYVERPFRRTGAVMGRQTLFIITSSVLAVLSIAGFLVARHGWEGRFPVAVVRAADKSTFQGPHRECGLAYDRKRTVETLCVLGAPGVKPNFVVIGDSHGDAAAPAVFDAARAVGQAGYQITATGYRPLLGFEKVGEQSKYRYLNRLTVHVLDGHPEINSIIIPIYWRQAVTIDGYLSSDGRRVASSSSVELGLRTLIMRYPKRRFLLIASSANSPLFGANAATRARLFHYHNFAPTVPIQNFRAMEASYRGVLDRLGNLPNVQVASYASKLCDARACYGLINGNLAYTDDNHLSYYASRLLIPTYKQFLMRAAQKKAGGQRTSKVDSESR